jgi:hypothetical protein
MEQPETHRPDDRQPAPDPNLRAAIDGLDELGNILQQALADDDALAAGSPTRTAVPGVAASDQASDQASDEAGDGGPADGGVAR